MQGTEEVQLVEGTRISISFTADQIGIRAGCNIMGGSYRLDGDVLVANALFMTEMGCDPPRDAQDAWIATFISGRPTIALDGNDLVLTVGDTSIHLLDREVAIPDLELVGPTWTLSSIITGDVVSSVPTGVVASLVFGDDGSVAIQTGCNSGGGRYIVDAATGTITFSDIVITERACAGGQGQIEAAVLSVLQAAELTYAVDAQTLQLMAGQIGLGLTGN